MACNDYIVYNYESYNQTLEIRDCEGFFSSNNVPPAGTGGLNPYRFRLRDVGEILSQGTLILEVYNGGEIPPEPTPEESIVLPAGCYFIGEIYEQTWWGMEVPAPGGWGSIYDCASSQELWAVQVSSWGSELNTYNELK